MRFRLVSKFCTYHVRLPLFITAAAAFAQFIAIHSSSNRSLNDAYTTADNQSRKLLIQLDPSAAFDSIDHSTLLRRLEHTFGLSDSVLH
jgi:hypothetical protein